MGPTELVIILALVLLVFGASRLPALGRSIGQASRELRAGLREDGTTDDDPPPASAPEPPRG